MADMHLNRSARAFVALATAFLLLLCQTAFAVQACAHASAPNSVESAVAPCHEGVADSTGRSQVPTSSACEAANALPDAAKVPVLALGDLPSTPIVYDPFAAPAAAYGRQQGVYAVCYSPPLTILHCRFLN
jgi:hypothetical protein